MWGTSLRQRLRLAPLYAALALADFVPAGRRERRRKPLPRWRPGLSVVIPDRDAPDLLCAALESVYKAHAAIAEPLQVVVMANGALPERYRDAARRHADVEWIHLREACGFSSAIDAGLARARYDWTLLLNNDMTLDATALDALAQQRDNDVFAVAAQILQRSADGRREETGFTDWYVDDRGVHAYHAAIDETRRVDEHLCASGGAALFRTVVLRDYVRDARAYDPFYWEDVEWSIRAHREGLRVLFCAQALAHHRHRATVARFHSAAEIDCIVERNRLLFDMRNAITGNGCAWLMEHVCDLEYRSQRDLSALSVAIDVLRRRRRARGMPLPSPAPSLCVPKDASIDIESSYSFRLRSRRERPCLLIVTPFCVFPARHGGARRVEGLLRELRREYDVVLVSDEASLHDARSFAHFDGLHRVTLVQRDDRAAIDDADLAARMRTHAHPALADAVRRAADRHHPDIIQVEHVELAMLSRLRKPGERWVLALHDACSHEDFRDQEHAGQLDEHVRETYDAVIVCSAEDQA